jgi:hypothetical protein
MINIRFVMKWRYFWIAVATFLGCWRVKSYNNFAGIPIVSPLIEILIIGMLLSLGFILYFLYKKYESNNLH